MTGREFFDEVTPQSRVKTRIVAKYFAAWANVIVPSVVRHGGLLAYIDFYAGCGKYQDGTSSTPLLVLERAVQDERLCERLVTIFNDQDPNFVVSLRKNIAEISGIEKLRHKPKVLCSEIGPEVADEPVAVGEEAGDMAAAERGRREKPVDEITHRAAQDQPDPDRPPGRAGAKGGDDQHDGRRRPQQGEQPRRAGA